jgi:hypothetical protein
MNSQRDSTGSGLVIVDPAFGEKLRAVPTGLPVWIAMSPANEPGVRSPWAGQAAPDHLTGITGFSFDESVSAEDLFLAELDTVDLWSVLIGFFVCRDRGEGNMPHREGPRRSVGIRVHRFHRH